jgi:hypothetical protein
MFGRRIALDGSYHFTVREQSKDLNRNTHLETLKITALPSLILIFYNNAIALIEN